MQAQARPSILASSLVSEADRQLVICKSCRYCEDLCAVFVALERRLDFAAGDVSHLAAPCHDCRSCLDACPYSPPHEFAVNPPALFAKVRREVYESLISAPGKSVTERTTGWVRVSGVLTICVLATTVIAIAATVTSGIVAPHRVAASPFVVVPHPAILIEMALPFLFSCAVLLSGARRYWLLTAGGRLLRGGWRELIDVMRSAASLKYLEGGDVPCHENTEPSRMRRIWCQSVSYGFALCLLSTMSAAVLQDIVGQAPPYNLLSVPVLLGLLGGAGLIVGNSALTATKKRSDRNATYGPMTAQDYGLPVALALIGVTGVATLLAKDSAAHGTVALATGGAGRYGGRGRPIHAVRALHLPGDCTVPRRSGAPRRARGRRGECAAHRPRGDARWSSRARMSTVSAQPKHRMSKAARRWRCRSNCATVSERRATHGRGRGARGIEEG